MENISVFISGGGDKRIVEEVQGCVYAGMFLENNGKIKIRPMCMRVNEIETAAVIATAASVAALAICDARTRTGIPTTIAMDYFFREMKKRVQEYSKEEIQ